MPVDPLDAFSAPVAAWFRDVFAEPTAVQAAAWRSISAGDNALVVAPTGSGKTLAAFLWSLSQLSSQFFREDSETTPTGTSVLYISPLKALGVDVDRNLSAPLAGIERMAATLGHPSAPITVGVRSGDTPQSERARLQRTPPDILITTPESLYLMLTSRAAGTLRSVRTVIVDEIHAVAGTKRGTHLALSLERLDALCEHPVQRIGLSATVNPLDTVAQFLGGDRPVTIVNPPHHKEWDVRVRSVVADFQDPPPVEDALAAAPEEEDGEFAEFGADGAPVDEALLGPSLIGEGVGGTTPAGSGQRVASGVDRESALPQQRSVWPHVQQAIYEQIMSNRSTLVFVNSRRTAERLTGALNELYAAEYAPEALAAPTRRDPAQVMAHSAQVRGINPDLLDAGPVAPGQEEDDAGVGTLIARAHHGSVSKDERADIEAALKSGELRCVVATSSLELGIDMGLVDHVIQVGAPPSVAAAVQRCGRAGHTVGAVSRATLYPLHKQDAEACAVIVDRLLRGELEPLGIVRNALDILAQHTIAAVAAAEFLRPEEPSLDIEEWWRTVRRCAPYASLPRDAFDGVIELVGGHYPSTDFADLRPRVIVDPDAGTLTARPGAQRLAVTSGGTIPDRGMFGVFLSAEDSAGARRVGELDEEMVYESRVGDIFTLGASSWRILEITRDQVIVAPAAGHTGRLPFWTGDAEGRPVELGHAIGAFRRRWWAELSAAEAAEPSVAGEDEGRGLRRSPYLDGDTVRNLDDYYRRQHADTTIIPDERTLLLERFRDDIGDWRVVIHTPFGRGVNAPWAMALGAQIQRRSGIDAMAVAGDDGLVLRLPMGEEEPGIELLLGEDAPDERAEAVIDDVMTHVGSSALFAGRFRECAARALLLPRRNPGARQPLWQQRQRAAQLLDIAREHPQFPVMVETMRECLHDVYNLDALSATVGALGLSGAEGIRVVDVTSDTPSAFAESLLFRYTGAFMYEGDSAERAAALHVDPALLAQVLGRSEQGLLLDPAIITRLVDAAQWRAEGRRARTAEQVVDMLRTLGPLAVSDLPSRLEGDAAAILAEVDTLIPRRLMRIHLGGVEKLAIVEDMPILRDGLGVPVPPGVAARPERIPDALDQLIHRWLRHRGPVHAQDVATEFGLGVSAAEQVLRRLAADRRVDVGTFTADAGSVDTEFIDIAMLRRLRSATLAAARGAVEPVDGRTYARLLTRWHGIGTTTPAELYTVIEALSGVALPASAWEPMILRARIPDYAPGDLDELLASGEVIAVAAPTSAAVDPLISLIPSELAPVVLPPSGSAGVGAVVEQPMLGEGPALSGVATRIYEQLLRGGAFLAQDLYAALRDEQGAVTGLDIDRGIWELFDAGLISPDTFAPVRARLAEVATTGTASARSSSANASAPTAAANPRESQRSAGTTAHRAPRSGQGAGSARRLRLGRSYFARAAMGEELAASAATRRREQRLARTTVPGRWSATRAEVAPATDPLRVVTQVEGWIDRYAVISRGAIVVEKTSGGFAEAYRTLASFEDSGAVLRGYIIDGLGGAQFAPRMVIDQLQKLREDPPARPDAPCLLAASDPANPYGAALPWPEVPEPAPRPNRGAGALVILADGLPLAYLTRGMRNLVLFPSLADAGSAAIDTPHAQVIACLSSAVAAGRLSPVTVERINGLSVMDADTRPWVAAGARLTPKGLRLSPTGTRPASTRPASTRPTGTRPTGPQRGGPRNARG